MIPVVHVRRALAAVAFALLIVQVSAVAVFPLARLADAQASATADDDPCCQGMGPGQTCPMHRKSTGPASPVSGDEARVCAGCCPDQTVTTTFDPVAVLPVLHAPKPSFAVGAAVFVPQPSPIALAVPPGPRPPRA